MRRLARRLAWALLALALAWAVAGVRVRAQRAPRPPPPPGELRGAWHVHTTRSDGRGTLAEVVRAARDAGLQFVVIADHNVLAPGDQGWRDGVLVITATEASTAYGHVVGVGLPRALDARERETPLSAIAALGGQAVIAHPLHPRRPFTGWDDPAPWRGFEVVSNDTAWHALVARRDLGRAFRAAVELPWDGARAVLTIAGESPDELALFDAELSRARGRERGPRARVLLCSADAHGHPSYRAAFEAFSMHVPHVPTGDADADARAILEALLAGRAACVFDGLAPASGVSLRAAGRGEGRTLELALEAPDLARAAFTLVHDGRAVGRAAPAPRSGRAVVSFSCEGGCGPGDYRVEGTWGGRPWIFTNPVRIE